MGNVYRGSSGGLRVSILPAKIPRELNIYTANLGVSPNVKREFVIRAQLGNSWNEKCNEMSRVDMHGNLASENSL